METSEYLKQATDFCEKTGTTFEVEYLRTGKHWDNDTRKRDIYKITITRGSRSYTIEFGQSLYRSSRFLVKDMGYDYTFANRPEAVQFCYKQHISPNVIVKNENFAAPTAYDFFSCVQKYNPGTFDEFCSEMGYDEEPLSSYHRVAKIYEAAKNEWQAIESMYSDDEITLMQEIQ